MQKDRVRDRNLNQHPETKHVPSEWHADQGVLSHDKFVVGTEEVRIDPRDGSEFGKQSEYGVVSTSRLDDQLVFRLSDPRRSIDLKNSYIEMDLKVRATDSAGADVDIFLDNGGVINFIKNISVISGNEVIHEVRDFNKLYNIWNLSTNGRDFRDRVGIDSADSWDDQYVSVEQGVIKPITWDQPGALYDDAGNGAGEKYLNLVAGQATSELKIGDVLEIAAYNRVTLPAAPNQANVESALGHTVTITSTVRVLKIISDNEILLEQSLYVNQGGAVAAAYAANDGPGQVVAGDVAAGGIKSIRKVGRVMPSARKFVVQTVGSPSLLVANKVTFKIPLGFFELEEYFPLYLLGQPIEITIELEEPHLAMVLPDSNQYGGAQPLLGYKMENVRFVAAMVEADKNVVANQTAAWKSPAGLQYNMLTYIPFKNLLDLGNSVYSIKYQRNVQSANKLYSILTNASSQTQALTQDSLSAYSNSEFNKLQMTQYQFKIGQRRYPNQAPINVDRLGSADAWKHLQNANDNLPRQLQPQQSLVRDVQDTSINHWQWASGTSDKFIMAMKFSKEHKGISSGIKLQAQRIDHNIRLSTPLTQNQILYTWLGVDQVVTLNFKKGILIKK